MRIKSAFHWNRKYGRRRAPILATSILAFLLTVQLVQGAIPSSNATTASPVVVWNQLTTALGLSHKLQAPFFARAYALVQVAIWDALLQSQRKNSGNPAQVAVVAGAASRVLVYLFPDSSAQILDTEDQQIAGVTGFNQGQVVSGAGIGSNVGEKIVAYARTDGSNAVRDGVIPTGPCKWTGTNPVGPTLGGAKTFILTSPTEFRPPPPYSCGSAKDLADIQAVIGAHNSLTPAEILIVHKWADLPPPTIWNNMLNDRIQTHSLSLFAAAHASVYLNVGMYDAFLSCWAVKYTYWTARPFQRIPGFVPVIQTPNFPSYLSGHSTVSSAASLIMGQLFPDEAGFFVAQAQEAAMSRLWGGIHFPQDNSNGLTLGAEIGSKVVSDMQGPIHPFVFSNGLTN